MRIVLLATLLLASANGGALPNIADTLKSTDAPSTPDMNQLIDALLNVDILSFSTPLKGTVANNSIKLQVTVEPVGEEGLKATLSKVELDELSGITITTGRGILAHLKDDIAKGLVWRFHRNIYTSVSSALAKLQGTSFNIPPIGNRFQASTPAPNGTH